MISAIRSIKNWFADKIPSQKFEASYEKISRLDSLNPHERGTIVALSASNELQGRLMGMGLLVGSTVEVLQGGAHHRKPLLVAVGETRIALGADIAQMILVETTSIRLGTVHK